MEFTLDSIRDIRLYQSKTGYRFSMDSVILASFVETPAVKRIADLGAGSGIIGLLLAKKYPVAAVTLFELQNSLAGLAARNIELNLLEERVSLVKTDIRTIKTLSDSNRRQFDVVVSNPPYRKERTGIISPDKEKAIARHEVTLKLSELADAASCLLRPKGRFFFIYHPERLSELINTLVERSLEIKRLRFVHSTCLSEAKMVMVEAIKDGKPGLNIAPPVFIYNTDGTYTEEMGKTGLKCEFNRSDRLA